MTLSQSEHNELIIARLIKYLHELRADTRRISQCLGYKRVVQGATEDWADSVLKKYGED